MKLNDRDITNENHNIIMTSEINFQLRGDLLYYIKQFKKQHLCILKLIKKEIFKLVHNQWSYSEFY